MWKSIGIILIGVLIAIKEIPYLRKHRLAREEIFFWLLLLMATGLTAAYVMKVNIPNPLDWIIVLYRAC